MVEFPKVKKEILEFVSNEDGRISHDSLIKLGIISIGALGLASSVSAAASGTSGEHIAWEYDDEKCEYMEITCKDTIEGDGDVTMSLGAPGGTDPDIDMEMDMDLENNCGEGKTKVRRWIRDNWDSVEKENFVLTDTCSEDMPCLGTFPYNYHQHENSILLESEEGVTTIQASHEHSIAADCDVEVSLSVDGCPGDKVQVFLRASHDGNQMFECERKFG